MVQNHFRGAAKVIDPRSERQVEQMFHLMISCVRFDGDRTIGR